MGNEIPACLGIWTYKLFVSQTEQTPEGKTKVHDIFIYTSSLQKPGDNEDWARGGEAKVNLSCT